MASVPVNTKYVCFHIQFIALYITHSSLFMLGTLTENTAVSLSLGTYFFHPLPCRHDTRAVRGFIIVAH